jgi:hypothetical protein
MDNQDMASGFARRLTDSTQGDVEFKCLTKAGEIRSLYAHRWLLSLRSEYFNARQTLDSLSTDLQF